MSVLVVGLSHRSAPVSVLEKAAVHGDSLAKLLSTVCQAEHVAGSFVVSTCNRVEVYAEVDQFHAGVSSICEILAKRTCIPLNSLTQYLYVHYEERAVQHLLSVACGLESMVVGESQILGQVRRSLAQARGRGSLGRVLDDVGGLALRAAKRAHSETDIDRAGANLVTVGIALAAARLQETTRQGATAAGAAATPPRPAAAERVLQGVSVLVVGAGSMSSLAVATAARLGAERITVANRTADRAQRLAKSVAGTTVAFASLTAALNDADLVISCTGAAGLVITAEKAAEALAGRPADPLAGRAAGAPTRPLVFLDLALPRDVDLAIGELPGVSVLDLESLSGAGTAVAGVPQEEVAAVRAIVAEELAAWASARHAARVAPTVVALRSKAAGVVEVELARLAGRLGDMDERARVEMTLAMHRVVEKLLHAPTVRVKQLAGSPDGESYEAALRVLFDLDPATIDVVTKADAALVPDAAAPEAPMPPMLAPAAREAP